MRSVAAAREMLGESVLRLVLTNGVEVRNIIHLGRGPNISSLLDDSGLVNSTGRS